MHLFADEGFLIMEYRQQKSILDLVNIAKSEAASGAGVTGGVMDESLPMFLSSTVEALHSKSPLHDGLQADNCLVRFEPVPENEWRSRYRRDGSAGWNKKGIVMIGFGLGIDMKPFNPNVQFIADWKTDQQDCAEMREVRPWTYQVDYHGFAAIIHSMLYGKYIVFDVFLDPLQYVAQEEKGSMPVTKSLRDCREKMEEWLETNCDKGVGLENFIRRMEGVSAKRK